MKTIFYVVVTCLLISVGCIGVVKLYAQRERGQQVKEQKVINGIEFASRTHNFGTIKEVDGLVECVFHFTNMGKVPVVIQNISVSCGCTTPSFSKEPIRPGATGTIKVAFDPKDRPGKFNKVLYLYTNVNREPIMFNITGLVEARPRTIEDDFPFEVGTRLRSTSVENISMGSIARGKKRVRIVDIYNPTKTNVTIRTEQDAQAPYATLTAKPSVLKPGERGQLVVTFDLSGSDVWGLKGATFTLKADNETFKISASAVVTEDFSEMTPRERADAPQIKLSKQFFHFGDVNVGETLKLEVTVSNTGKTELIIRNIEPSSSVLKYQIGTLRLGKGQSTKLTISYKVDDSSRLNESLMIVSNSPNHPLREIRIMANIK